MTEIALVMLGLVGAFFIGLLTATNYCNGQLVETERKLSAALDKLADARGTVVQMQSEMLMLYAWWQGGQDDDDDGDDDGGEDITQVVDIYLN